MSAAGALVEQQTPEIKFDDLTDDALSCIVCQVGGGPARPIGHAYALGRCRAVSRTLRRLAEKANDKPGRAAALYKCIFECVRPLLRKKQTTPAALDAALEERGLLIPALASALIPAAVDAIVSSLGKRVRQEIDFEVGSEGDWFQWDTFVAEAIGRRKTWLKDLFGRAMRACDTPEDLKIELKEAVTMVVLAGLPDEDAPFDGVLQWDANSMPTVRQCIEDIDMGWDSIDESGASLIDQVVLMSAGFSVSRERALEALEQGGSLRAADMRVQDWTGASPFDQAKAKWGQEELRRLYLTHAAAHKLERPLAQERHAKKELHRARFYAQKKIVRGLVLRALVTAVRPFGVVEVSTTYEPDVEETTTWAIELLKIRSPFPLRDNPLYREADGY